MDPASDRPRSRFRWTYSQLRMFRSCYRRLDSGVGAQLFHSSLLALIVKFALLLGLCEEGVFRISASFHQQQELLDDMTKKELGTADLEGRGTARVRTGGV